MSKKNLQLSTTSFNSLQLPSTLCNFFQLFTTSINSLQLPSTFYSFLQLSTTFFNSLQLPSTFYNFLQLSTTFFTSLQLPLTLQLPSTFYNFHQFSTTSINFLTTSFNSLQLPWTLYKFYQLSTTSWSDFFDSLVVSFGFFLRIPFFCLTKHSTKIIQILVSYTEISEELEKSLGITSVRDTKCRQCWKNI